MFLKTSRYATTPQVQLTLADGSRVNAVQLRGVPATSGDLTDVTSNDRLDVMAARLYGDATRWWHVADANADPDSTRLFSQWLADDVNAPPPALIVPEN